MRYVFMLLLCIGSSGAMALTLWMFFRRLRRIEVDMWGEKARSVGGVVIMGSKRDKMKRAFSILGRLIKSAKRRKK